MGFLSVVDPRCRACNAELGKTHKTTYGAPWIDQAGGTYHPCALSNGSYCKTVTVKDCER